MSINDKLVNIQAALKAPKGQYNSFGKYSYRSCEDILEAVKPLLKKEGLALLITDDVVLIGERYYVKASCHLMDGENQIVVSAFAREEETRKGMDGSQITGSASSYARKYALGGLFCIDDVKDADAQPATVYKCAECGRVFDGCTPEMYAKVQSLSPDGVARCKDCRKKLSRKLDEEAAKEDEDA